MLSRIWQDVWGRGRGDNSYLKELVCTAGRCGFTVCLFFFLPRIVIRRLKQYEADEVSLDTNQSGL